MIRFPRWLAGAGLIAAVACGSDTITSAQPGNIFVKLQSPNSGFDGAILFTLNGPTPPTNVTTAPGDTLWTPSLPGTVNKVIITGPIRSGVILTFGVPDVNQYQEYVVSVGQVASSSDYSLRSIVNYLAYVSK